MSAYICDREHIQYLVQAAMSRSVTGTSGARWFHAGEWKQLAGTDYSKAPEVANMLLMENIRSVSCRYPNESSATLPGDHPEPFTRKDFATVRWHNFKPRQVWHSCRCYDYQACESDDWRETEAYAFISSLKEDAGNAMAGEVDHNAGEWGAPTPDCNAVSLFAMSNGDI